MTVAGFGVAGGPRAVHFLRPLQPVHQEPHIAGPRRLQVQFIWIPVGLPPVCVWMGAASVPAGVVPVPVWAARGRPFGVSHLAAVL